MPSIKEVYTESDLSIPSDHDESVIVGVMKEWGFKFVVAKMIDNNLALAISHGGVFHSDLAAALLKKESGGTFMGAGEGKIDKINWGSNTCREIFGFDTPRENSFEENKVLLEDIRLASAKKIAELEAKFQEDESEEA